MIQNRSEKWILKAFLELDIPEVSTLAEKELICRSRESLKSLANRLLMSRNSSIEILPQNMWQKEDKVAINNLITRLPEGKQKAEMVFFYRLAILVELILLKYQT